MVLTMSKMSRFAANLPLAFLILLSVSSTCAADATQDLIDQLPRCSRSCLSTWATSVGCSQTDIGCQCAAWGNPAGDVLNCLLTACRASELERT